MTKLKSNYNNAEELLLGQVAPCTLSVTLDEAIRITIGRVNTIEHVITLGLNISLLISSRSWVREFYRIHTEETIFKEKLRI